jgi:L-rhamnose-H+ transport protein
MASAAILSAGLVIYARAARQREQDAGVPQARGDFRKGMSLCLFTGAAAGAINLGFAFSADLVQRAAVLGASPEEASFAVWAVLLPAGYIPNLVYCAWLLRANRTARVFRLSAPREGLLAFTMAVLWLSGWLGYGVGASSMGRYGTSIGFAAYMTALLLWSTCLGLLTGEWRTASPSTRARMRVGLIVILGSVLVLSAAL